MSIRDNISNRELTLWNIPNEKIALKKVERDGHTCFTECNALKYLELKKLLSLLKNINLFRNK